MAGTRQLSDIVRRNGRYVVDLRDVPVTAGSPRGFRPSPYPINLRDESNEDFYEYLPAATFLSPVSAAAFQHQSDAPESTRPVRRHNDRKSGKKRLLALLTPRLRRPSARPLPLALAATAALGLVLTVAAAQDQAPAIQMEEAQRDGDTTNGTGMVPRVGSAGSPLNLNGLGLSLFGNSVRSPFAGDPSLGGEWRYPVASGPQAHAAAPRSSSPSTLTPGETGSSVPVPGPAAASPAPSAAPAQTTAPVGSPAPSSDLTVEAIVPQTGLNTSQLRF